MNRGKKGRKKNTFNLYFYQLSSLTANLGEMYESNEAMTSDSDEEICVPAAANINRPSRQRVLPQKFRESSVQIEVPTVDLSS